MKSITWRQYITSSYWKAFSKSVLDDVNVKCAICGRERYAIYKKKTGKHKVGDKRRLFVFNLHHIDYKNLGEGKDNIIPLCTSCHTLIHNIEKTSKRYTLFTKIYDYICKNSAWGYEKAKDLYVPNDFAIPKTRTKKTENKKSK